MAGSGEMSYWLKRQLSAFEEKFTEADKDKNGSLSYTEICDVLKKAGFKGTDEDMQAIFKFADTNKDSKISKTEYVTACKKAPKVSLKEMVLRRAFRKMDKDGSGFLTHDEIAAVAASKEAGLDVPAAKIADLLSALIRDADHKFSYEEFLQQFHYDQTAMLLRDLFKAIDKDKSGFLTRKEIMDAVKSDSELAFSAANVSQLLVTRCKDQKDKINYEEFVKIVKTQAKK